MRSGYSLCAKGDGKLLWYAPNVINGFILNTANIISGKPYTSRGVRAVWEGGDASPAKDELNLTS